MTSKTRAGKSDGSARILRPESAALRRGGWLSAVASLLWPAQAFLIALTIQGWVLGAPSVSGTIFAAGAIVVLGLCRAALEARAQGILFDAADRTIARERRALLSHESRARSDTASAELAAMVAQKLPLLSPWITRFRPAILRVMVVSPVLALLVAWHSWAAALVLLVAGPLVPVTMAVIGIAAGRAARRQLVEVSAMNALAMERLSALLELRLIGAAPRAVADFETRADGLRARTMTVLRVAFLSSTLLELLSGLGMALIAIHTALSLSGMIGWGYWTTPDLGSSLFVLLLVPACFQPLRDMAAAWHDRASGLAVVAELAAHDNAPRRPLIGAGAPAAPLPGPLSLRLNGAVAQLPGRGLALPDLELRAGESVALTGPSGAGKSTMLGLITGLLPLADGQLEVCGLPLTADTADGWRARLAYVPQKPHFSGRTLRDWLDPRGSGTDPWPALDLAQARGIVDALPDGLDSVLGETGGGVSGGEARRLLIARAVLAGGDLLIADEPTADLDPDTATLVTDALLHLRATGRSLLVATHDPDLAARMDRIIEVTPT